MKETKFYIILLILISTITILSGIALATYIYNESIEKENDVLIVNTDMEGNVIIFG